jgi:RNA-directed DNA polymerase
VKANAKGESAFTPTESKTTGMAGHSPHGSRETPVLSAPAKTSAVADRSEKASRHKSDMHGAGESDSSIVPKKSANNERTGPEGVPPEGVRSAEPREGRGLTKENAEESLRVRTQRRKARSRGLLGVREAARRDKRMRFNNLLHHLTPELLRASFLDLKRQAAPGIDGVTWSEYAGELEGRIADLHQRIHRGTYRAQPSKRAWIPKPDGRQRPLGIAALEDKIVQRATRTVLECIYEEDFLGFSYGYRPGRGGHRALDALYVGIGKRKVNWIIDADIRGFFDTISHEWLLKFLEHRIADRRMLRLLKKWLRAGVSEEGEWSPTKVGTPQGAVISPLLANVFLHYVLDLWIEAWRKQHAKGEVIIVRYADDFVMGFREEADAKRCLAALKDRFLKFGLELHPEKTRLIEFGRYAAERRSQRGEGPPETFDFLGFTHLCSKTRKGNYTIRRISSGKKLRAKLKELKEALRWKLHQSRTQVGGWLKQVYQGWLNYHAIPGNYPRLEQFRTALQHLWLRLVRRRSQRGRRLTWAKFRRQTVAWLPHPTIRHPYPAVRFGRLYPR